MSIQTPATLVTCPHCGRLVVILPEGYVIAAAALRARYGLAAYAIAPGRFYMCPGCEAGIAVDSGWFYYEGGDTHSR